MAKLQTLVDAVVQRVNWQLRERLENAPAIRVYVHDLNFDDFHIRLARALKHYNEDVNVVVDDSASANRVLLCLQSELNVKLDIIHQMQLDNEHCFVRYDCMSPVIIFTDMSHCV